MKPLPQSFQGRKTIGCSWALRGLAAKRSREEALRELISVWKITSQPATVRNSWEWKEQTVKQMIKAKFKTCPEEEFYCLNQQMCKTQKLLRDLYYPLDCIWFLFLYKWVSQVCPKAGFWEDPLPTRKHLPSTRKQLPECPYSPSTFLLNPLHVTTSLNQARACSLQSSCSSLNCFYCITN